VPLGERNPKWLNDDYVKFIRFAQMKMEAVEDGIVGIITNHSWLDNPTFRGMRQSLMRSFEQIYVLDLHGSAKKKERAPDGSEDKNVFDIQQGVAISLFVKRPGLERGVWRSDLWGTRMRKYEVTAAATLGSTRWARVQPALPFRLFVPQDSAIRDEYQTGWRLPEIFPVNVLGFQTHRDAFAVSFTEAEMRGKLGELADPKVSDDELTRRYGLKSNRDWSFPDARCAVRAGSATAPRLIAYRPFDDRWGEFSALTMDYPRRELLDHVSGRQNLCILVPRQIGIAIWRHAFVATAPAESCLVSTDTKSQNYVFPERIYHDRSAAENFSPAFREFIDEWYEHHYTPEEIFGYIYAVLYAPTYRARYAEFLRIDFPRVPFPEAADDFERLSELGWALIQAHLVSELPRRGLAGYHGRGDHRVEFVRYAPADQAVIINKAQSFRPVPPAVWEFRIGGYQVLDKYLKSRKNRTLSLDEIEHVAAVADSLAFTIEQMARIDDAYRAAFPEQV
jgi:predicted helicase